MASGRDCLWKGSCGVSSTLTSTPHSTAADCAQPRLQSSIGFRYANLPLIIVCRLVICGLDLRDFVCG
jgi:hypothetical protein